MEQFFERYASDKSRLFEVYGPSLFVESDEMKLNWISIYLLFACARQFAKNELKKKMIKINQN